ncbi:MAG: hypothetical protein Q9168_002792 [Polycauliona sp. 1 TL-2023]
MPCPAYRNVILRATPSIFTQLNPTPPSFINYLSGISLQQRQLHVTARHRVRPSCYLQEPLEQPGHRSAITGNTDDVYLPFDQTGSATQHPGNREHDPVEQYEVTPISEQEKSATAPKEWDGSYTKQDGYSIPPIKDPSLGHMAIPYPSTSMHPSRDEFTLRTRDTSTDPGPLSTAQQLASRERGSGPIGARAQSRAKPLSRDEYRRPASKRETWQIQKDALSSKFGAIGWTPRKRLSPDALEGIRALHAQFPDKFSTPVLADQFEVSAEAIRRILKSKWRPSNDEATSRKQRWDKRGERIWGQMVALGVKPPKKWREMGVGRADEVWDKTAVYAGENIDCVITFKNVAQAPGLQSASQAPCSPNSPRERWKDNTAAHARRQVSGRSPRHSSSTSVGLKHRKALSHDAAGSNFPASPRVRPRTETRVDAPGQKHKRSVSIVSIGGENSSSENPLQTISTSKRPTQSHGRAASLQILPGKSLASDHDPSFGFQSRASSIPTQEYSETQNNADTSTMPLLLTSPSSPMVKGRLSPQTVLPPDKSKPMSPAKPYNRIASSSGTSNSRIHQTPTSLGWSANGWDVRSNHNSSHSTPQALSTGQDPSRGNNPGTISPQDNDDTLRTSTDLNSFSSDSSDTMASEYVIQEHRRFLRHPITMRQQLHLSASQVPETLMMGYGNIVGSFYLDPSLVDTSHFDEVKRKAVVGNEGGGGVVRAESTKRQSGLLGSLGWSAIGESLEGLLGRHEVSSIKEGTDAGAAKWMPILSTPQSLLFVDLRLEPGQSQSYSYSFRLPAGIPPSYRGKAVKFSYSIVIGVQRSTRSRQRHLVRRIDVPFRVIPSVNDRGETMGHDLMSPHVMLHNDPMIMALSGEDSRRGISRGKSMQKMDPYAEDEFSLYMGQLLDVSRRDSSLGLLSPSAAGAKSPHDVRSEATTMESAISLAIQQSNSAMPSKLSANRFEITRNGLRVAVIMLARPAYRLGEIIPVIVDLHTSEFQCFSLRATLETSEYLDSTLALRSPASVLLASRRVHATQHETTTSADRVFFNLAVPSSSTPEFITSAVSLEWRLRFEFVTSNQADRGTVGHGAIPHVLEEVAEDERGTVSIAVEAMPCETFEVTVPLHIYGGISQLEEHYVQSGQWFDIGNARARGQFKPRNANKGTSSYQLRQFAEATLGSGSLRKAVKLPEGEDLSEWLAVNVVDFYNQINLLYGSITEFCSPQSCPEMKATDEFEYLWQDSDKYKRPTKMPAPEYIEHLMAWVQGNIDNEAMFPSRIGVPFPKTFPSLIRQLFKRLYRVYAHIYCHHYPVIIQLGLEPHLNTSFKHYVLFIDEHSLASGKDFWGPLGDLVDNMLRSD